jgi:predicted metal-dependent phosphoesterase TrpH
MARCYVTTQVRTTLLLTFALSLLGCASEHGVVDLAMTSAYRPRAPFTRAVARAGAGGGQQPTASDAEPFLVLGGDLHCHVLPPDDPSHVVRGVRETVALAREEHLDFVVLTPHVPARFFVDASLREYVASDQRALRAEIASALVPADGPIMIPGFEYTDHRYGHVGAGFADLDAVLADVPLEAATARPGQFFESWLRHGGTLIVNHPLVVPLDSSFSMARADISWRPLTSPLPVPEEIATAHELATGFEAYNLTATHLRDRYLQRDTDRTLAATYERLDHEAVASGRAMTAVGGTDSHSHHLRATTFVLARERSAGAIREALGAGRVCVRDPGACTLRVRGGADMGRWAPAGEHIDSDGTVLVRTGGDDTTVFLSGTPVARVSAGEIARIEVPANRCSIIRATVGRGYSGSVYVNCPWPTSRRDEITSGAR